jgi:hypothetical protein
MGYTTEFEGTFRLSRPLTVKEKNILDELADTDTRHYPGAKEIPSDWKSGIHDKVEANGLVYPGYHCDWQPTEDGTEIEWNHTEKFYDYKEWLQFIIDTYLTPWGITLTGKIEYQGESIGDHGTLSVSNNKVIKTSCR